MDTERIVYKLQLEYW